MGRVGHVLAMLALVAVLDACSFERPTHVTVFPANATTRRDVPVRFFDRTGLVRDIRIEPLAAGWGLGWSEEPMNPGGQADQVLIRWMGGACEDATVMDLREDRGGYLLVLTLEEGFLGGSCPAIGIPRQVLVTLEQPLDAGSIEMVRG